MEIVVVQITRGNWIQHYKIREEDLFQLQVLLNTMEAKFYSEERLKDE